MDASGEESVSSLGGQAAQDLSYIRDAMSRAKAFTAVSGKASIVEGALALTLGGYACTRDDPRVWLAWWLVTAVLAAGVGFAGLAQKARRTQAPYRRGPGALFLKHLVPPLIAGAALTGALSAADQYALLPGLWLLLYGAGLFSAGSFSVGIVPHLGLLFAGLGLAALAATVPGVSAHTPDWTAEGLLLAGFGGAHLIAGALIWRKYGG
jgi:hypothetical protein